MQPLINLFESNGFIPHGYCLSWSSILLWLHVVSDVLIVLSYYSIPLTLAYFIRKRKDLPYPWLFAVFGLFIVACGTTHLLSVITIWIPLYWLDGVIKAVTAIISVIAALMMLWVVPRALLLRSPAQLEAEIQERKLAQKALQKSEALLRHAQSISHVGHFKFDLSSGKVDGSDELFKIFGLSRDQFQFSDFWDTVHPDNRATVKSTIDTAIKQETGYEIEHRLLLRDGTIKWIMAVAKFVSDTSTKQHSLIGTVQDITERKQAETALTKLSLAVEQSHNSIVITDLEANIEYVNQAFVKETGYSFAEVVGQNPRLLQSGKTSGTNYVEMWDKLTRGEIWKGELINRRKDNSEFVESILISPVRQPDGRITHYLAVKENITERKLAEEELKRSNVELEQFSYAVSHDLRQPLRMISSYLQLLEISLSGQLDGEKRNYFNFAIEGAKRIDQMLVALLEYSRVGRMGEPHSWVDSRTVLDESLQFLKPIIAESQAKLNIVGEWPRIFVSRDEILRLLQNLIANAIKFRIAGRTPEITVSSEIVGNEWCLCISDNGIGIIPEQIKRLFQVFQRLQSRDLYEGTGIGLALCRKIAEHHKGRIWAESAGENRGSKFCVALPALREMSSGRSDLS